MSNYQPPAPPPPPGGGGGYGAPPPAGPPGGGYGGPPGGGYGGPPAGGGGFGGGGIQPYSAGDAFSYGWTKFQGNVGQMVLSALAIFLGAVVILGLGYFLAFAVLFSSDAGDCVRRDAVYGYCEEYDTGGAGFLLTMLILAVIYGIFFIYAQVVGAGMIRASLNVTNGQPFRTADVFKFDNIGPVIVTSILVGLGVMVGTVLCYLPGIVFGFFSSYSLYFVVDKNMSPVDAIKASFSFVNKNLGSTIIWYLLSLVIIFVGSLLCGVGLLVAIPVALVGTAYTYRKLNGEPIAP